MQGFIADLRRLAITCDFGAFLDRSLRDQLVFGLHSEQIRKTLLAEDSITLTRAVEIAQATESAFRDAKALQGATNATATVLQMSSSVQANHTGRPKLCSRCGRSGHDSPACIFRLAECHKYGKIGHTAPACRSQKSQSGNYAPRTNYFESSQPRSPSFEDQQEMGTFVCSASKDSSHPIQVSLSIIGKPLVMQLDTGAAVSLMAESTFQKLLPETQLKQSNLVLKTYTGELMDDGGSCFGGSAVWRTATQTIRHYCSARKWPVPPRPKLDATHST